MKEVQKDIDHNNRMNAKYDPDAMNALAPESRGVAQPIDPNDLNNVNLKAAAEDRNKLESVNL